MPPASDTPRQVAADTSRKARPRATPGISIDAAIVAEPARVVESDRTAHLVREALRGFQRSLQLRIAEHGVPIGHWRFLRVLWEQDGLTQRQLADRVGLMESTAFIALKAMERLGYVRRIRNPKNGRQMQLFITPRGRALKKVLEPLAEEVNRKAVLGVQPEHIKILRSALVQIIENLVTDEANRLEENYRIPSNFETSQMIALGRARPRSRRSI
jgi:DNA-binding MarR family transcriptional regulator